MTTCDNTPPVDSVDVLDRIRAGFMRHALFDHATITVQVDVGAVTLTGTVGSRAERDEAERITQAVPGVDAVHNLLDAVAGHTHDRFRR